MAPENKDFCNRHYEFNNRIETMEKNISELWKKWNWIMGIVVVTLMGVVANLAVVLVK